jgi:SAM-dependent methyltransferase
MLTPKDILGCISGGRVLDVATGSGGFIPFLLEGLKDYTEIIGLDANERAAAAFAEAFKDQPAVRFEHGNALDLHFPAAAFDFVCIANSLHHFDNPRSVLLQMRRVLRPGGHLLVAEMYRDGQTETQLTHVYLHHWWAAVDTLNGVVHHETYLRDGLVELVRALKLSKLSFYDLPSAEDDPKNPEILTALEPVFERYLQRAAGQPDLQVQGETLRRRVQKIGFHNATTLVALGSKPG